MNRLCLASRPAASLLIARQGSSAANRMAIRRFTEDINPSRLFIGGLSWGTDENKLKEAFEGFGEVRHGTSHFRLAIWQKMGKFASSSPNLAQFRFA
jgi:RNA recognition motif-containing protein